jgi:hypothetical protein
MQPERALPGHSRETPYSILPMINFFTAFVLLCSLAAFTACKTTEPVTPDADRQGTLFAGDPECIVYYQVSVDTITKGSYLGFTIGEKAGESYTVVQNLWQQKKVVTMSASEVVVPDFAQLGQNLPLYSGLFLGLGERTGLGVSFTFEAGVVKTIALFTGNSSDGRPSPLTQWPASEPPSLAVRTGDPVATVYEKLTFLKDKAQYAGYFNAISLNWKELSQEYDPALDAKPLWTLDAPTEDNRKVTIELHFQQGTLSAIYVRRYA